MRYHVKGGIWKNTEDEILKAAVMKYGLNQWSRISSLLVRKSAKQCKERWYEWLDPSIKKTEWTKEEEEKLLHLSKMFPCQWRTIAPFVGRSAYQCMEHYEKLLDRAQGREPDENDPRKLRPGEIDPNPETKPARPDPIDMDEDEKEMLNEARARLANTRGKKAKRKAREKQLEEARRLAALQKKRELKASGIDVVLRLPRKKKKEMNYNADIPFERNVPEGSWRIGKDEKPEVNKIRGAISLQVLENRNRDEIEERNRKIDKRRIDKLKGKNLPEAIEMINKMNDPANIVQRAKLILPEPQVTEKDLEGISKLTASGITFSDIPIKESSATKVLMGEYSQREMTPLSMIRTPKLEDNIMREAKMAFSLREGGNPLEGGENSAQDLQNYLNYRKTDIVNKPLNNQFKTPVPITPNLFAQSAINSNPQGNKTIDSQNRTTHDSSLFKSPLRDEMRINMEDALSNTWENNSTANQILNKSNSVASKINPKVQLKNLLSSLPKPQNNYDIDILEAMESKNLTDEVNEVTEGNDTIMEDAEDRAKRLEIERIDKEREELQNQSQVVNRNLIRPLEVNFDYNPLTLRNLEMKYHDVEEESDNIHYWKMSENYIKEEMLSLIEYDNINYPLKGTKVSNKENFSLENYGIDEKKYANELIKKECEKVKEIIDKQNNDIDLENYWKEAINRVYFNKEKGLYMFLEDNENSLKFDNYSTMFDLQKKNFEKDSINCKKLEDKANLITNGYIKRSQILAKQYDDLMNKINELKTLNNVYKTLEEQDKMTIEQRKITFQDNIVQIMEKEKRLQRVYKSFVDKIEELEKL